ncbi:hypothetical protein [Desulfovibrio cuneatus]|uniref:hypothetical protein n=1 Tax=Desulfovibrio cuneatus TaxID=159728 RepID=UPI00146FC37F|nr:hypothetical protein [Desulfovibrio cuneatus]
MQASGGVVQEATAVKEKKCPKSNISYIKFLGKKAVLFGSFLICIDKKGELLVRLGV